MKIAFFGLPLAAERLAHDGHEIVYAGACMPAPGLRRLRRLCAGRTWLRPDLAAPATAARVRDAAPELIVSWFCTSKLPTSILAIAPAIGVHPSLLPRHRGPDPFFWALDCGDEVTGVTAHLLEAEYDTGAILARRELRIDPRWNAWQLARALDRPSLALVRETVQAYASGRPPAPVAQDGRRATQAPAPSDDALTIRWSWTAERVERRVRAAAPWPGTWTQIGEHIVALVRVRPTLDFPAALAPGEAAVRSDGVAVVRAASGAVELWGGRTEEGAALGPDHLAEIVRGARA